MTVVLPPMTSCTLNFFSVCTHWWNRLSKFTNRWSSGEEQVPRLGDEHVATEAGVSAWAISSVHQM
jgi:hypothetical protein